MSDTPETDAAIKDSEGQWSFVLKEACQRLERERDETMDAIRVLAEHGESEIQRITKERDEAMEKAERYRLEANAMMLQRDEAREILREIAEASGFDNIGNWARNKAKSAIYR